ncbi:MAG: NfeD family protein [Elusimicrobiales bacterium]
MFKTLTILSFLVSLAANLKDPNNVGAEYRIKNVLVATYSGIIIPVADEYISMAIDKLNSENFDLLVIRLDTPGGLESAMRNIVKKMLSSKKPVAVLVYPKGGRAASAGVFITVASHIAAMSPSTNIGAAHPIMLGGDIDLAGKRARDKDKNKSAMEDKVLNDAKAYIKSICQYKNRNTDWAVNAVTKSDSITALEALKYRVIEFIAEDEKDLLKQLHNHRIENFGVLLTDSVESFVYFEQTKRQKFLSTITDPNIAMLLMSIGAIGIFIELYNPGLVLPGVVGAMSLVIGLYAFQTLSANFAGVLLIILGLVFLIAEIKVMSYGLLTFAAAVSIFLGGTILFKSSANISGVGVDMSFLTVNILGLIAVVLVVGYFVIRAQMRRVATGVESLIGARGKAFTEINESGGKALIEGEIWECVSESGVIKKDEEVVVVLVDGFKLRVKRK